MEPGSYGPIEHTYEDRQQRESGLKRRCKERTTDCLNNAISAHLVYCRHSEASRVAASHIQGSAVSPQTVVEAVFNRQGSVSETCAHLCDLRPFESSFYKYWPVFSTVWIDRPGSVPSLVLIRVRM